jgi:imidazole glycerol phosphate synthase subunit HisF
LIVSGGAGNLDHIRDVFKRKIDGVALVSVLYYNILETNEIKQKISDIVNIRLN